MARLKRRGIAEAGPRSAHVAGLPYACFATPLELDGATLELIAPRPGDPDAYAAVRTRDGRLLALTATCAANALGLVPAGSHAAGSQVAALAAFEALGGRIGRSAGEAARALLDAAVDKIVAAVDEASRAHKLDQDVPIVALGGSGAALAGEVGRRLGRPVLAPDHPEVLSSIGAALSLVRAEAVRTAGEGAGESVASAVVREAERACVEAGAAPDTVRVECAYEAREGVVRAVATGAVALESGAAGRAPVGAAEQKHLAAQALGVGIGELIEVAASDFYRVFCENGSGPVAVVDSHGSVPLSERARRVVSGRGAEFLESLNAAVADATVSLGVAEMLPRVAIVAGPRIVDTSEARRSEDISAAAELAIGEHDGPAVGVVWR
jgi:hypothetical protein